MSFCAPWPPARSNFNKGGWRSIRFGSWLNHQRLDRGETTTMSKFGETLFGGSPFVRWSLTPFVILFALLIPMYIQQLTPFRIALIVGMELACCVLLAGFWLPERNGRWAFRALAGAVFLFYFGYFIDKFVLNDAPFKFFGRRAEASPRNALVAFIVIGLPCLWYALFGRFTFKPSTPMAVNAEPRSRTSSPAETEDDE
jgi:hypothetical protein